jgi:hypothetical protein
MYLTRWNGQSLALSMIFFQDQVIIVEEDKLEGEMVRNDDPYDDNNPFDNLAKDFQ